jgi:hypothetical protein
MSLYDFVNLTPATSMEPFSDIIWEKDAWERHLRESKPVKPKPKPRIAASRWLGRVDAASDVDMATVQAAIKELDSEMEIRACHPIDRFEKTAVRKEKIAWVRKAEHTDSGSVDVTDSTGQRQNFFRVIWSLETRTWKDTAHYTKYTCKKPPCTVYSVVWFGVLLKREFRKYESTVNVPSHRTGGVGDIKPPSGFVRGGSSRPLVDVPKPGAGRPRVDVPSDRVTVRSFKSPGHKSHGKITPPLGGGGARAK